MKSCPVCLTDLVDGTDVRVIERRRGLGLVCKATLGIVIGIQVWRQELQRHDAVEAPVDRLVDAAHPAATELLNDLEVADLLPQERVYPVIVINV